MSRVPLLLGLVVTLLPSFSWAQAAGEAPAEEAPAVEAPAVEAAPPGRRVVYQKETELDFEAQRLTAEVADDGAEWIYEPARPSFHSFVKLRRDFNDEMAASVDEVQ